MVVTALSQNWLICPAALATHEAPPQSIRDQKWLIILTGVLLIDLAGNNDNDWRRETVSFLPDIGAPLQSVVFTYAIPAPVGIEPLLALNLDDGGQWAPFATIGSVFDKSAFGVDVGFAVDGWRLSPLFRGAEPGSNFVNVFDGIDIDVAVRNTNSVLHRVNYQITLLGRVAFLVGIEKAHGVVTPAAASVGTT
jgi:hypothetical protein